MKAKTILTILAVVAIISLGASKVTRNSAQDKVAMAEPSHGSIGGLAAEEK